MLSSFSFFHAVKSRPERVVSQRERKRVAEKAALSAIGSEETSSLHSSLYNSVFVLFFLQPLRTVAEHFLILLGKKLTMKIGGQFPQFKVVILHYL